MNDPDPIPPGFDLSEWQSKPTPATSGPHACGEPTVMPVTVIRYRAGCACGWSLTYTTPEKAERAAQGHVAVGRHRERLKADRD